MTCCAIRRRGDVDGVQHRGRWLNAIAICGALLAWTAGVAAAVIRRSVLVIVRRIRPARAPVATAVGPAVVGAAVIAANLIAAIVSPVPGAAMITAIVVVVSAIPAV